MIRLFLIGNSQLYSEQLNCVSMSIFHFRIFVAQVLTITRFLKNSLSHLLTLTHAFRITCQLKKGKKKVTFIFFRATIAIHTNI
jgi:hypothetical protein